jgi:hypothetical protein
MVACTYARSEKWNRRYPQTAAGTAMNIGRFSRTQSSR